MCTLCDRTETGASLVYIYTYDFLFIKSLASPLNTDATPRRARSLQVLGHRIQQVAVHRGLTH